MFYLTTHAPIHSGLFPRWKAAQRLLLFISAVSQCSSTSAQYIAIYTRVSLAIHKERAGNIALRRLTEVTSKKHLVHCTSDFFQWNWTLHSECFLSYRLQLEVYYCQIYRLTCWPINKLHGLVYGEGGGQSPLLINNLFTLRWPWTNSCNYLALHFF